MQLAFYIEPQQLTPLKIEVNIKIEIYSFLLNLKYVIITFESVSMSLISLWKIRGCLTALEAEKDGD